MRTLVRIFLALAILSGSLCPAFCLAGTKKQTADHSCCSEKSSCGHVEKARPSLPQIAVPPVIPAAIAPQTVAALILPAHRNTPASAPVFLAPISRRLLVVLRI